MGLLDNLRSQGQGGVGQGSGGGSGGASTVNAGGTGASSVLAGGGVSTGLPPSTPTNLHNSGSSGNLSALVNKNTGAMGASLTAGGAPTDPTLPSPGASAIAPLGSNSTSKDTQLLTQIFCRFLFQQLHREADLAIIAKNRVSHSATATAAHIPKDVLTHMPAASTSALQRNPMLPPLRCVCVWV